jgi:cytochrome bd-type quinol oxidase subunit 1
MAISIAGFSSPGSVKAWLATGATAFALGQVASALVISAFAAWLRAPRGLHRRHRGRGGTIPPLSGHNILIPW